MPRKRADNPGNRAERREERAERRTQRELRQSRQENRQATSSAPTRQENRQATSSAPKRAASRPAPKKAARSSARAPKYSSQASPGNPNPTAERPGRYDVAGKYMGASSPVQLPGGGGMSAKMAASIQRNPSQYQGYTSPAGGTPKYNYNYWSSLYQGAVSLISPPNFWDSPVWSSGLIGFSE